MEISIYEKCISDVAAPWSLTSDVSVCNFNCHVSGLYYTKAKSERRRKKSTETIDMAAVAAAARTLQIQLRSLRSADFVLHYNNRKKIKCRHLAGYLRERAR